ncbi:hypothetical protein AEST_25410 [Alishewanella aestuarii B11]|uniref:Uncharacterized protein n=1 Tax=Alishewanella aestuarii B11 TaxID=1197174 RepID=J1Q0Q9_9ALTE|nr:hypothetical protein AEST_25410 [Alishewanella aestuarii B11]
MIEVNLPRTFLIVSTAISIVLVWYCKRWIRWQQQRAEANANAQKEQGSENE